MSLPALDRFPHAVWARLVARHAHALTHAQMAYGDPAGQFPLRVAIAEHLRAARGVRCEAEQVLIVSGSQAALRLATAVLLARGTGWRWRSRAMPAPALHWVRVERSWCRCRSMRKG